MTARCLHKRVGPEPCETCATVSVWDEEDEYQGTVLSPRAAYAMRSSRERYDDAKAERKQR